jgi:hypothetical protein
LGRRHFAFDPLHGAVTEACKPRNLVDAGASGEQLANASSFPGAVWISLDWPATKHLAIGYGSLQASVNALPDHTALKLGKSARDFKHKLAAWRSGIEGLLIEVQVNLAGFEMLNGAEQINQ